jgi:hypothetical protein
MNTNEVLRLALEALKQIYTAMPFPAGSKAITALETELAKPDFWEGYVPEPVKPAHQCKWPTCQSEEYQQALAEQIKRELVGEQPAQQDPVSTEWQKGYLQGAAEQEEKYKWDIHSCGPTCTKAVCVAMREAVKAEREECAKVAETYREWDDTGMGIAEAIRARSNT